MEEIKNIKIEESDEFKRLRQILVDIRNVDDRCYNYSTLMSFFNYSCSPDDAQIYLLADAFLLKATLQCFRENTKADIMLMDLGLMKGYDYHRNPHITSRREKYLREKHPYDDELPYDELSRKDKTRVLDRLSSSIEEKCLSELVSFLLKQKDNMDSYINESNEYIKKTGKNRIVSLPTPSYIKEKAIQIKIKCMMGKERIFSELVPIYTETDDNTIVIDIPKKTANLITNASNSTRTLLQAFVVLIVAAFLASNLISYKHDSYGMSRHENKPTVEDFQKNPPSSGDLQEEIIASSIDEFE